jgi:hypothetical protein
MLYLLPAVTAALCGTAFGWTTPTLTSVCNSAPAPGGVAVVDADASDAAGLTDDMTAVLFYSFDNQATWQQTAMAPVGLPGYDSTLEASFPVPGSGSVRYFVRASSGSNFGTQSPFNSGNVWPVSDNWLAEIADEPAGDTFNSPRGAYLDLTSAAIGSSDSFFYCRLTNNNNSWPTRASILGPWFIYAVGFRNPAAPSDTWGFAMTYCNIAGIYSSGLFESSTSGSAFERFADIDAVTSGNRLVMRCRISDLLSRERFGPWPNEYGFLTGVRADTRSADLSMVSTPHDTTGFCRFYVNRTPGFMIGPNAAPILSQARVVPRQGQPETNFWFNARYTDADSNLPVVHSVVVDDDTFSLKPNHHQYWAGVLFDVTRSGFEVGWHRFHFLFNDGMAEVTSSPDSFEILGTAAADPSQGALDRTFDARPNPFSSTVRLRGGPHGRSLMIFDHRGRMVRSLATGGSEAAVTWDGRDGSGCVLPDGVYFLRDDAGPLQRLLVKLSNR